MMSLPVSLRCAVGAFALLGSSLASAAAITANVGWVSDTLATAGGSTTGSPWTFVLSDGETASFKVTDAFIAGDSFFLYDGATLLASSSAYVGADNTIIGNGTGESAWKSASYEKFEYVFSGAGSYSFTIKGDGVRGVPAGLFLRLDVTSVPEPTSLALVALSLMGAGIAARRKARAA